MNMHLIDWAILLGVVTVISVVAYSTKKYTQSVADFLAANRCAGKYLLGVADGIAGLGAISIVAMFEMYFEAGFTGIWWGSVILPIGVIVAMTGWIQYRFRETRALTMAQFFEIRYSRRFRIFAGFLCFLSGIVNFGIFPAVGGRFFQYFMGLPNYFINIGSLEIDLVYAAIMLILLIISLAFTFMGGQIAVIVTDFIQGAFCNIALVIIAVYLLFFCFDWSQIIEAVSNAPENASLINPLKTGGTKNFNCWYFLIQAFCVFFTFMAWQGNQGYYGAARTPHDARMGRILGSFRTIIQTLPIVLIPIGAFTVLNHPEFSGMKDSINAVLNQVDNPQMRSQITTTVAAAHILPIGLLGLFAAVMFAAFVSTHDTYLHSWGSIFIQDIVLPIRQIIRKDNKPLEAKQHINLLRYSIIGVAVFIFLFSLLFNQRQDILMFFALTGTIFLGWAGAVIVGGLYWKYGNSAGAWTSAVFGFILAITGWYMTYYWKDFYAQFGNFIPKKILPSKWDYTGDSCPVTAQVLFFWTVMATNISYVIVSLVTGKGKVFNMERMLHRGEYAIEGEHRQESKPATGWRIFGMSKEFTFGDKLAFIGSYAYVIIFFAVFVIGTIYALKVNVPDASWASFWKIYALVMVSVSAFVAIWLTVGGIREMKTLFVMLKTMKRDADDDGTVVGHQSLADIHSDGSGQTADSSDSADAE
jgi:SSS family solute:Na+ symporter